ncbi:protein-disulfide reductase DsbD domain-containing protein [Dokdonella sp.]|uniref:protein-disulfide reductase DsbD domain-containing protein n=1 Tax=Dokdonella sp. TaxID=2291710 RepID=UPI00352808E6
MNFQSACVRFVVAGIAALAPLAGAEAVAVKAEHVTVELVSESSGLVPGEIAWLGLRLRHDPHWHTYWINPGDSGLPTRLKWQLPDGFAADAIVWPAPTRFEIGGLYNFGHAGEVVLPVAIHVPKNASPGRSVPLAVDASWLVCREECITGKARLDLELPVVAHEALRDSAHANLFASARNATPAATDWSGSARLTGNQVEIRLKGADLPQVAGLDVFAVERRILGNAPPDMHRDGNDLVIIARKNDYFDETPAMLDLVLTSGMTNGHASAWQVRVPFHVDAQSD